MASARARPIVETAGGRLRGSSGAQVEAFLGVRFAQPPVGKLRFRSPRPAPAWSGVRDAMAFGPPSLQTSALLSTLVGPEPGECSEDCLFLNVWRPRERTGSLPVLVFIHGGGFLCGSTAHPMLDGASLAAAGHVIVVTIQYRLGVLGLLAHPALEDPATGHWSNWALQDQTLALQWVAENIGAFGGDAGNITLAGQSAGGASVAFHCINTSARRWFTRAIIQSSSSLPVSTAVHSNASGDFLAGLGGNPGLRSLQTMPTDQLLAGQDSWVAKVSTGRTAPRPMVDGVLIPDWPNACIASGATDQLDIMVTYTRDEMRFFALFLAGKYPATRDDVISTVPGAGSAAAKLYALYETSRAARGVSTVPFDIFLALGTDRSIRVPAMDFLARHADRGNKAWAACVNWESSYLLPAAQGYRLGACHMIELPLLFGTYHATPQLRQVSSGTGVEQASRNVQAAWLGFIKHGDPNAARLPRWPTYQRSTRATMLLGAKCQVEQDPAGAELRAMTAHAVPNQDE